MSFSAHVASSRALAGVLLLGGLAFAAPAAAQPAPPPGWPTVPFRPVTPALIETAPAESRAAWREYHAESLRRQAVDRAALDAERKKAGLAVLTPPAKRRGPGLRLREAEAWYRTPEARRLAAAIRSFQTPAGGWTKATDYTRPRAPGEHFAAEPTYLGTFDNDATVPELRFLARVAEAGGEAADEETRGEAQACADAFTRGLRYVFAAQYPNGGFPQIYPLAGGYHDAVTFNDGAMVAVLGLLRDIATGRPEFAWLETGLRAESRAHLERGVACILAAQTAVDGQRVAWGQQHDAVTLAPCAARNFEPVAHTSAESAGLALFLMSLDTPSTQVVSAVDAAVVWLKKTALHDVAWTPTPAGRDLVAQPGAGPLWSRFYEIGTDRPVFGDRDRAIRYVVGEVSVERRNGYAWFVDTPAKALAQYARWQATRAKTAP